MKLAKPLTLPLKATLMASAFASVSFADPVNYWNMVNGGKVSAENEFCLDTAADDTDRVAWEDGNCLITGSRDYPANIGNADRRGLTFDVDVSAYGVRYISGGGSWSGTGKLTIGAGGYNSTRSWDRYHNLSMSEIHLAASQTWTRECAAQVSAKITAEDNVVWTLTSDNGGGLGRSGFEVSSSNDLSNAEIVLKSLERLSLINATAMLQAKSLTMEANTRIYYHEAVGEPVFGRKYASTLILKGGAVPAMTLPAEPYTTRKDTVIYDFDRITVADSTVKFGDGFSYSVKDGGTQLVEIAEGATLMLSSLPTAGRIKVTGAGKVSLINGLEDVDFENFTGSIAFADVRVALADTTQLKSCFLLEGATVMALPATTDWPEGFSVDVGPSAKLILPRGSAVDSPKITGTGTVVANGVGLVTETAEEISVASGETVSVVGDGIAAATTLVLNGGKVDFPVNVTVAGDVSVVSASELHVMNGNIAIFTGSIVQNANLTINNDCTRAGNDWPCGRVVFAGNGTTADGTGLVHSGGALEFRGATWTFAPTSKLQTTNRGRYLDVTQASNLTFEKTTQSNFEKEYGYASDNSGEYWCTFTVSGGSTVVFEDFRKFAIGSLAYCGMEELIVDNSTIELQGYGAFELNTSAVANFTNTSSDRSPMGEILVRNGGLIKTDRVFSASPVLHNLDQESYYGKRRVEGLFVTLDGGTWKLGPKFGLMTSATKADTYPIQKPNYLFGATTMRNVSMGQTLTNTCEITMMIGKNGGTFDLSEARADNHSFTNTPIRLPIPNNKAWKSWEALGGADFPCRGPQWQLDGRLTVKGNGDQELVLFGIDPGTLDMVGADGALVKVIDTNGVASVALSTLDLGSAGGVCVEGEDGQKRTLSIDDVTVAANGAYDASWFDSASVTFGNLGFCDGSTLTVRNVDGGIVKVPILGSVTLANAMNFLVDPGLRNAGAVLSPASGVLPAGGEGVVWTRLEGSRGCGVSVSGNDVLIDYPGTVVIVR